MHIHNFLGARWSLQHSPGNSALGIFIPLSLIGNQRFLQSLNGEVEVTHLSGTPGHTANVIFVCPACCACWVEDATLHWCYFQLVLQVSPGLMTNIQIKLKTKKVQKHMPQTGLMRCCIIWPFGRIYQSAHR